MFAINDIGSSLPRVISRALESVDAARVPVARPALKHPTPEAWELSPTANARSGVRDAATGTQRSDAIADAVMDAKQIAYQQNQIIKMLAARGH